MFENGDNVLFNSTTANCQTMTSRPRNEKVSGTLPLMSPRGTKSK